MYGDSNLNVNSVNKIYKKGQDALKTSFFALKFKPDFLTAVSYFTEAAAGYKKLALYKDSLKAFDDAIKCNMELLESWAEAQNWQEMADICIFNLHDFNKGWQYLKNASLKYKYAGKFTSGIKVYQDFAQRLMELNSLNPNVIIILQEAVEDCFEHTHDELIRISLEESFGKLLDVYCLHEKYVDAINLMEKYIKMQKSLKDEKKHKISTNYIKLGMLRIIIEEVYMAENIIQEMYSVYDSSCSDDIEDMKKLCKSFKAANKKDFTYLINYAYSLFQNNLLKGLKKAFDKMLEEHMASNMNVNLGSNQNVIHISQNEETSNMVFDETMANSEIGSEVEPGNNQNNLANAEGFL